MNTRSVYSVVAVAGNGLALWGYRDLTPGTVQQYLEAQVAGALVHRVEQDGYGRLEIDVEINAESGHEQTLVDLATVLGQLGLGFAASQITEYVAAQAATAIGGALVGAGVGGAFASAAGVIVGGAAGLLAGDAVGATRLRVVRRYSAQRQDFGGWQVHLRPVGFREYLGWSMA